MIKDTMYKRVFLCEKSWFVRFILLRLSAFFFMKWNDDLDAKYLRALRIYVRRDYNLTTEASEQGDACEGEEAT